MKVKTAGFTLLELIVVIAIIGLLSTVVFGNLGQAKDKAKEVVTLKEIRSFNEGIFMYELDTGTKFDCNHGSDCTEYLTSDPGVPGWKGPYIQDTIGAWGGRLATAKHSIFAAGGGAYETKIFFTNDRPGLGDDDDSVKIPTESMINIDKALDDGDLSSGLIRGLNTGNPSDEGQLIIKPQI